MEVSNTFCKIIDCFKEKIPVTDIELKFVCQTSAVDVVVVFFF